MNENRHNRQPKRKSPDEVRRNMSAIRSSNTTIERNVRSALWRRGYRFRKNDKRFPGKPDIVFPSERVAVFCDSDYWHGRDWENLQSRLQTNRDYWITKIERNRQRDHQVTGQLESMGWTVIRLWESDIKRDLDAQVESVVQRVNTVRRACQ